MTLFPTSNGTHPQCYDFDMSSNKISCLSYLKNFKFLYTIVILSILLGFVAYAEEIETNQLSQADICEGLRYAVGHNDFIFPLHEFTYTFSQLNLPQNFISRLGAAIKAKGIDNVVFIAQPNRVFLSSAYIDSTNSLTPAFDVTDALQSYDKLVATFSEAGFIVPNVARQYLDATNEFDFYLKQDHHWSPAGAKFVAESIKKTLEQNNILPEANLDVVVELANNQLDFKGSVYLNINGACPLNNLKPQKLDSYAFNYSQDTTNVENALFSDSHERTNEIVLIGTSNSRSGVFYFHPFLEASLQTQVDNTAIGGGGRLFGSLEVFFRDLPNRDVPEILIWEVWYGALLDIYSVNMFRRIIPSVHGKCTKSDGNSEIIQPVLNNGLSASYIINSSKFTKQYSSKQYIYLDFDNQKLARFKDVENFEIGSTKPSNFNITYTYSDGSVDVLPIFSNIGVQMQTVFAEFSDRFNSDLRSIEITVPTKDLGDLSLTVCEAPDTVGALSNNFKVEKISKNFLSSQNITPISQGNIDGITYDAATKTMTVIGWTPVEDVPTKRWFAFLDASNTLKLKDIKSMTRNDVPLSQGADPNKGFVLIFDVENFDESSTIPLCLYTSTEKLGIFPINTKAQRNLISCSDEGILEPLMTIVNTQTVQGKLDDLRYDETTKSIHVKGWAPQNQWDETINAHRWFGYRSDIDIIKSSVQNVARPDVAKAYGDEYGMSGFEIDLQLSDNSNLTLPIDLCFYGYTKHLGEFYIPSDKNSPMIRCNE